MYEVFISFKHLDDKGLPTRDSEIARELYDFLTAQGISVFFSAVSLEALGIAAYKKAIDDALDGSAMLVAVATSADHLESQWVRYEWDSFCNDILSGMKKDARLFSYVEGLSVNDLPRALRQHQMFVHPQEMTTLANFIAQALGHLSPADLEARLKALQERGSSLAIEEIGREREWEVLSPILHRHCIEGGLNSYELPVVTSELLREYSPETIAALLASLVPDNPSGDRYLARNLAVMAVDGDEDVRAGAAAVLVAWLLRAKTTVALGRLFRTMLCLAQRGGASAHGVARLVFEQLAALDRPFAQTVLNQDDPAEYELEEAAELPIWDGVYTGRWWQPCPNMCSSVEPDGNCRRCGLWFTFRPHEGERIPEHCPQCGR